MVFFPQRNYIFSLKTVKNQKTEKERVAQEEFLELSWIFRERRGINMVESRKVHEPRAMNHDP